MCIFVCVCDRVRGCDEETKKDEKLIVKMGAGGGYQNYCQPDLTCTCKHTQNFGGFYALKWGNGKTEKGE